MTTPFEIVGGAGTVYLGPVNEARPDLNDAPAGNWVQLGTTGVENYAPSGIVVTPSRTMTPWYGLSSKRQKAFLSEQSLMVSVTVHDLTSEELAKAFNDATVTDTAPNTGTAGVRDFDLALSDVIPELGILVRFDFSPYMASGKSQFWIPRAYRESVNALTYVKEGPTGWELVFQTMEHSSNGYGKYEAQDAAAN